MRCITRRNHFPLPKCLVSTALKLCPRGDLNPHAPQGALAPQASASTYSATRTRSPIGGEPMNYSNAPGRGRGSMRR